MVFLQLLNFTHREKTQNHCKSDSDFIDLSSLGRNFKNMHHSGNFPVVNLPALLSHFLIVS